MLVRVCEANNRPVGRSSPGSFDDTPSKVATGKAVASYSYDPYGAVISKSGSLADLNPLRYRGYYYDTETGFYYLQSRYYDPALGRFINGDSYAATGQGYLGFNMFAYCNNNPVISKDPSGHVCVNLEFWMECTGGCNVGGGSMMGAGMTAVGAVAIAGAAGGGRSIIDYACNAAKEGFTALANAAFGGSSSSKANNKAQSAAVSTPASPPDPNGNKGKKNRNGNESKSQEIPRPNVKYPGNDPTQSPGENYEWRGPDPQGGKRGGYVNIDGSDSWHPDLDHPDGIGPHWDYNDPLGYKWRIYPDWIEFVR